jgi:hypothetical protein
MEISTELQATIENLYSTFARYPLRADTDACPCCHSAYDEERLRQKPLRKLGKEHLEKYAFDALNVWGGVDDFKHFLPRLFELEAEYGDDFLDPEVALGKLTSAEWRYWPELEQRSIEEFLKEVWSSVIRIESHDRLRGWKIAGWLCGVALADWNIKPYLDVWLAANETITNLNLAGFIANTDFAEPNSHGHAYWGGQDDQYEKVKQWVRGDSVRARMNRVAKDYGDYEFVERAWVLLS